MSIEPSPLASSVAGARQAGERPDVRERQRRDRVRAEARTDHADEVVLHNEAADAVRSLKSNDQEEAREDRQSHPGPPAADAGPGQIDVSG